MSVIQQNQPIPQFLGEAALPAGNEPAVALDRETHRAVPLPILLRGITWKTYETLLNELENHGRFRIAYDQGNLEIMPKSSTHEVLKRILGRLLDALTLVLYIPIKGLGETTWNKEALLKGIEADECYFIRNERLVRGKLAWDFSVDPFPDLAIESDVTASWLNRMEIYAAMGIPEVWRITVKTIQAYHLVDGKYEPREMSLNLPFLRVADLMPWVRQYETLDEHALIRNFMDWVQTTYSAHARKPEQSS